MASVWYLAIYSVWLSPKYTCHIQIPVTLPQLSLAPKAPKPFCIFLISCICYSSLASKQFNNFVAKLTLYIASQCVCNILCILVALFLFHCILAFYFYYTGILYTSMKTFHLLVLPESSNTPQSALKHFCKPVKLAFPWLYLPHVW